MMNRNLTRHLLLFVLCILAAAWSEAPAAAPTGSDAHEGISCRLCHGKADQAPAADAALARQQRCVGCHPDALTAGRAPSFHGRGRCLSCHSFHDPSAVTTVAGTLRLETLAGVNRAHCRSCHDGRGKARDLPEAHREAGRLYHEHAALLKDQDVSTPCLWCHGQELGSDWQAVPASDRIAFSEHASHPFGLAVRPGRGAVVRRMREVIDPRIPLPGGRIECVSCHQLTAGTKDRLRPLGDPKALCLGCHELDDKRGGAALLMAGMGAP